MGKEFIEREILKYLYENNITNYKSMRVHIFNLTKEYREKEVENTKKGESKVKVKKKLISEEDLTVWEIILDLISKKVITPITDFSDMDKSKFVVSDLKSLDYLLEKESVV